MSAVDSCKVAMLIFCFRKKKKYSHHSKSWGLTQALDAAWERADAREFSQTGRACGQDPAVYQHLVQEPHTLCNQLPKTELVSRFFPLSTLLLWLRAVWLFGWGFARALFRFFQSLLDLKTVVEKSPLKNIEVASTALSIQSLSAAFLQLLVLTLLIK